MSIFDRIREAIWTKADAAPAQPALAMAETAPHPDRHVPVDVAAVLDGAVVRSGQHLDWQHSIVDLMKALGLDSSLEHRKALAVELGYQGDTNNTAAMNSWLHASVIEKLKANGGRVPEEL